MNHVPTWGELAQLVIALVAAMSWFQSWRNGRKIEVIHKATNSLTDKLVLATGNAAHAAGRAEVFAETQADAEEASSLSKKV